MAVIRFRMKVKVLPMDTYFEAKELEGRTDGIPPVFNREGKYMTKKACWFEAFGMAFPYPRLAFIKELQYLNDAEVDVGVTRALIEASNRCPGILSKEQRRLVAAHYTMMNIRTMERSVTKGLKTSEEV